MTLPPVAPLPVAPLPFEPPLSIDVVPSPVGLQAALMAKPPAARLRPATRRRHEEESK